MRIGQTSFVVFGSKLLTSILGFVATIYFARFLGAEVLGYYALAISLASWISIGGDIGVSSAVTKRISEGDDPDAYFTAGLTVVIALGLLASIGILLFQNQVNSYIGVDVEIYIVLLVLMMLVGSIMTSALEGEQRVHISGVLSPLRTGTRSFVQISLVFLGLGLVGMLIGHIVSVILVTVVATFFVQSRIVWPRREHFRSLFDFAKFSWLGSLRGRIFNDVDIIILGLFVVPDLVGIYSVAWGITNLIGVFGSSIEQTTFPELSQADAQEKRERVAAIFSDSIAFTGLIAIPGFFGTVVLADRLLLIYGGEFTRGGLILVLLMLATLFWDYYNQFLTGMNALNRPDVAFRINALFIVLNLVLNLFLVATFGWVGAAIATVVSAGVGLLLSFRSLYTLLTFDIPVTEFSRQLVAAILMAVVVAGVRWMTESTLANFSNILFVLALVALGASIYFATLLTISPRFRSIVAANSPFSLPI